MGSISNFFIISDLVNFFSKTNLNDIIDIAIIWFLACKLAVSFKHTRSIQVLSGILLLVLCLVFSEILQLNTISFIFQNALQSGIIAIIILFQPEIRNVLSKFGRKNILFFNYEEDVEKDEMKKTIQAISASAKNLSEKKIGALMVIEKTNKIMDIIHTGIKLDSYVSAELLNNIFYPKAPLHDGAVIISKNRITSASCFLPLSQNNTIDSGLGTRHRAGIGISEVCDCVVVIVSEETGKISLACDGSLTRNLSYQMLEEALKNLLIKEDKTISKTRFKLNIKRNKGSKK